MGWSDEYVWLYYLLNEEDEIHNKMEDLEEIREEINVKEAHLSELDVVKNQLSREQARISLLIHSYEVIMIYCKHFCPDLISVSFQTKLNKSEAEILGQQQKILHLKNEVNETLDVLIFGQLHRMVTQVRLAGTRLPLNDQDATDGIELEPLELLVQA